MKKFFALKPLLFGAFALIIGLTLIKTLNSADQSGSTFFSQFVVAGGPIVWLIQIPLSIVTVYLIIEQAVIIRRKKLVPAGISSDLIAATRNVGSHQAAAVVANQRDMVSTAVRKALSTADVDQLESIAAQSLQDQAMAILRKVEWHNIIGNISPMLGLLGTVIGMIETFTEIGVAKGQAHPSQLAHGISIAWVATFWGLLVAIPALAAHGIFRNRLEAIAAEAANETEKVLLDIKRNSQMQNQPLTISPNLQASA